MSRPVKIYVLSFIESVIMKSTALQKSTLVLALLTLSSLAQAADQQARQRYNDEVKHATALYNDDKKLCADAINSAARMQCLRDAKAEYDHAVAKAKANLAQNPGNTSSAPVNNGSCPDCAKVTAVTVSEKEGEGSALGVIAGGVAGALLGNQVGGGTGRDLATIAGAAGGAYAGRKIEQRVKSAKVWDVSVQYADGNKANFKFDHDPGLRVGDTVQRSGESIVRR